MSKTKKIISLLLSVIMIMSVFNIVPLGVSAAEAEITETGTESGTTGDCTWTLDDNGVLTISGNGKMGDYIVIIQNGSLVPTAPWGGYSINTVVIENGVTSIGDYAFIGCTGLTSVDIPDSVTSIGRDAFYGCTGLTSIDIPDSVTSIGSDAFENCTGLTTIIIPDSVTNIGGVAFSSCSGLTSIKVAEGNTVYDSRNDCNAIINTESNELIYGCKNTVIPNSVTSIGGYAFCGCTGLTSVTIPDSVTSIGDVAFYGCTGLTSVTIPDSVTSIGDLAFCGCTGLTSIKVAEGNTVYDSRNDCNAIINTESNELIYGCKNTVIPDSVTSIGDDAFQYCTGLTSITIGNSVTSIGDYAFYGCTGLTSVTIPDSVTSIGRDAFYGCTGLTSVTIPDSVASIGYKAFGYYYVDDWNESKIDGFTIYGKEGSEAERYAKDNGFKFISGMTVKGTVTSYIDDSDVTVKLTGTDNNFTAEVKGTDAYEISAVPAGNYTLTVSKANHVTREYTVTVADTDVTQDVKLSPKGDVNGDGETDIMDCSLAQRYIRELTDLDPYQIACGDVSGTGDGELDIQDVSRILRHIRELAMLY